MAVGTLVAELALSSFVEGAGPIASASRGWWRIRRTALRFAAFAASTGALAALSFSASTTDMLVGTVRLRAFAGITELEAYAFSGSGTFTTFALAFLACTFGSGGMGQSGF